ncbi:shikimate kinase [soil metagenome]
MERSWILVGMMGSGKSAVGRALADASQRKFVDTDLLLQARFGRPVSQIFEIYGESTFRDHETSILKGLQPEPVVLATGGGIVLREENWTELRRLGVIIFLHASEETLLDRLEKSKRKRPLLEAEDWKERAIAIYEKRLPTYLQADIIVPVDNLEIEEAAERVSKAIQNHV